jgi:hypothetical protein
VEELEKWKKWKSKLADQSGRASPPKEDRPLTTSYRLPPTGYQKSICALNFTKRGCNTEFGVNQLFVVGENAWL